MRLKNIFSNISLIITFPFRFLKNSKIDNFAFGLIFGAVFSLVVNVATVRVQENINKQRVMEALEREIVSHFLMTNSIFRDQDSAFDFINDDYIFPVTIGFRYNTRVYESSEVTSYLFELDPAVAAKIESYYDFVVKNANRNLERNEVTYNKLSEKCQPVYDVFYHTERESVEVCNELTKTILVANTGYSQAIYDNVQIIRENFHPAQDRLDSWWLSLLLGDKAYEVVKISSDQ